MIVGPRLALTALHCLAGGGDALLAVEYGAGALTWTSNSIVDVKQIQRADLALVRVADLWRERAGYQVASAILSHAAPAIGTAVEVYGHPPTIYRQEGQPDVSVLLSGIIHLRQYVEAIDDEFIRCAVPLQQGMSGGPLFTMNGELAGVTQAGLVSRDRSQGETLFVNLMTHMRQIQEAIASTAST